MSYNPDQPRVPAGQPGGGEFGPFKVGKFSIAQWAAFMAQDDRSRIDNAIRSGLIGGLDNTAIARKVVGSAGMRGVDGVTEVTRRRIAHLGRAAIKRV